MAPMIFFNNQNLHSNWKTELPYLLRLQYVKNTANSMFKYKILMKLKLQPNILIKISIDKSSNISLVYFVLGATSAGRGIVMLILQFLLVEISSTITGFICKHLHYRIIQNGGECWTRGGQINKQYWCFKTWNLISSTEQGADIVALILGSIIEKIDWMDMDSLYF